MYPINLLESATAVATLVSESKTGVVPLRQNWIPQDEQSLTRPVYMCDCHPGVCSKLKTIHVARYPLMIGSSLSSPLSSVKHMLQDVNRKAQNRTYKQPFRQSYRINRGPVTHLRFYSDSDE